MKPQRVRIDMTFDTFSHSRRRFLRQLSQLGLSQMALAFAAPRAIENPQAISVFPKLNALRIRAGTLAKINRTSRKITAKLGDIRIGAIQKRHT